MKNWKFIPVQKELIPVFYESLSVNEPLQKYGSSKAFIIDKDSIGYNQIKGRDLYGKFEDDDLRFVNIVGNSEVIHFVRDEEQALIGIEKTSCSEIHFMLRDGKIETSKFITFPDGQTYPPSKLPVNARKLRGFKWRELEKPLSKNDIFIKDEE